MHMAHQRSVRHHSGGGTAAAARKIIGGRRHWRKISSHQAMAAKKKAKNAWRGIIAQASMEHHAYALLPLA